MAPSRKATTESDSYPAIKPIKWANRGTTFCENAESVSIISMPYKREARFTVQLGLELLEGEPEEQRQTQKKRQVGEQWQRGSERQRVPLRDFSIALQPQP